MDRDRDIDTDIDRDRDTDRDMHTVTDTDTDMATDTVTETETETKTETGTETERGTHAKMVHVPALEERRGVSSGREGVSGARRSRSWSLQMQCGAVRCSELQ